mmetsp:Transcript_137348/g.342515  ORF Transcript_137348/g.342515 Transcript_137348/m.342515 type:complete len:793 (-) Transcript_137348:60-2438(-)
MAPKGTAAQTGKDSQVEFTDVKGRKLLFKLNTSGALDYYVDGRQKVSQIKDLRAAGSTLLFDGKRLMTSEKEAEIPKPESEAVVSSIMSLCNKAIPADTATPANIQRCFVQVLRAEGLRAADVSGKSDPYCICGVPRKPSTRDQTARKRRTLAPVWNEFLEIHGYQSGEALDFVVMDHDFMTKDDFLGWARVSGTQISSRYFEGALELKDDGQHGAAGRGAKGKLHVKIFITGGEEEIPIGVEEEKALEAQAPTRERSKSLVSQELAQAVTKELSQVSIIETDDKDDEDFIYLDVGSDELARKVFEALDVENTSRLGSAEVRRFAEILGFQADDSVWAVEYKEVCAAEGWDTEVGPDVTQFVAFVGKPDSMGLCDEDELESVLRELKKQEQAEKEKVARAGRFVCAAWLPKKKTQEMLDSQQREDLISDLFSALDVDEDKHLISAELRRYAEFCGFDGTEDEWSLEYTELCSEYGWEAEEGADLARFTKLVENVQDGGYSANNELRECAASVSATMEEPTNPSRSRTNVWVLRPKTVELRSQRDRSSLVNALFHALDTKSEGLLGPDELRRYAELCGFDGDEDDWAVEYAEVCHEFGINARGGATREQFAKLMDTKAGQADLSTSELARMIDEVKQQAYIVERRRPALIRKRSTWRPLTTNFEILRTFSLFLRKQFVSADEAFMAFTSKPFGRLTKAAFLEEIQKFEFEGDAESVFRLLALGSIYIVKKHIKWAWNLLAPEDLVRARKKTREDRARSRGKSNFSVTSTFSPSNSPVIVTGEDVKEALFPPAD